MNGNDLLAQIENENPKLGIYLRNYLIPTIQPRGRAGQVLATPPDAVGNASLRNLSDLVNNSNPPSASYVGTNKSGQLVSAPTPQSGITQLTADVTAGPGSGSQAATVVATHLAAPLPVAQGGTGTATPSLVAGSNVTISGTWPNQTVAASGSVSSLNGLTGALSVIAGSNITITPSGSNIAVAAQNAVSFGAGAPTGTANEGDLYFNISASPFGGYVFHGAAWNAFT